MNRDQPSYDLAEKAEILERENAILRQTLGTPTVNTKVSPNITIEVMPEDRYMIRAILEIARMLPKEIVCTFGEQTPAVIRHSAIRYAIREFYGRDFPEECYRDVKAILDDANPRNRVFERLW